MFSIRYPGDKEIQGMKQYLINSGVDNSMIHLINLFN